jgi:phage terminase small subunit
MSQALTTRQDRFVTAYTGNATQAGIEAGYSPRSARQHAQATEGKSARSLPAGRPFRCL